MISRIGGDLFMNVNDHERPQREACWKVADRGAQIVPMRGRIKLRSVLIGWQLVGGGNEAVLLIGELIAFLGIIPEIGACNGRLEFGMAETRPNRLDRFEGMSQIDILRCLEAAFINIPEGMLLLSQGRGRCHESNGSSGRDKLISSHAVSSARIELSLMI
jgi:hypothetical protein